jgi:hypothetical protein
MTHEVKVDFREGIALVTMNQPEKMNALTTAGFIHLINTRITLRALAYSWGDVKRNLGDANARRNDRYGQ